MFTFGAGIIIALVLAIFFFIRESWLSSAFSTFVTIVGSVPVKWVVSRRKTAVTEEENAYEAVKEACQSIEIDQARHMRQKHKLFWKFL